MDLLRTFEANPFALDPDERRELSGILEDQVTDPKAVHRAVMGRLEAGAVAEAERVLLAVGHADALAERRAWPGLAKRVWAGLPRERTDYLRVVRAAARCTRALDRLVGESQAMRALRRDTWAACFGGSLRDALYLGRVIVDHDVLILGETGTGKEALAQAIQDGMPADADGDAPRASLNAAAIPETLVESALFGHTKGAFTGAERDRTGAIRQAHGGCLFLDEVGDLPRATQVKLLRVMETDVVQPLGADEPQEAHCRYVAATHLDLRAMVERGDFRRDLYERLAGHVLRVAPLRERREDIPELGRHFVRRYLAEGELPEVWDRVTTWLDRARRLPHSWPGNVRELQNMLRSVLLGLDPTLDPVAPTVEGTDLPTTIAENTATLREVEDWYLARVLAAQDGSAAAAARVLGIDRGTVRRRLDRIG
tara:strand:- start:253 stop:1530 length:1278 start_codon:yes stop_codon:yes gene_type:complete